MSKTYSGGKSSKYSKPTAKKVKVPKRGKQIKGGVYKQQP